MAYVQKGAFKFLFTVLLIILELLSRKEQSTDWSCQIFNPLNSNSCQISKYYLYLQQPAKIQECGENFKWMCGKQISLAHGNLWQQWICPLQGLSMQWVHLHHPLENLPFYRELLWPTVLTQGNTWAEVLWLLCKQTGWLLRLKFSINPASGSPKSLQHMLSFKPKDNDIPVQQST